MKKTIQLFLILFISISQMGLKIDPSNTFLTDTEEELYELIMDYRRSKGLKKIPLSKNLSFVAQTHCRDQAEGSALSSRCNLHSWSKKGEWTSCCYTPNHKEASCMWNKPKELTSYTGTGYEISYSGPIDDAAFILKGWKGSKGHNQVIINRDIWKKMNWQAIGIGARDGYANVWFGEVVDED